MENYNPQIITSDELPTPEDLKAVTMINRYLYWMTNQSNAESLINALGKNFGEHMWTKLHQSRTINGSFYGDMEFWFMMDNESRARMIHYINKTGYRTR